MEREYILQLFKQGINNLLFINDYKFSYYETYKKDDEFGLKYKNDLIKRTVEFNFWPEAPNGNNLIIILFGRIPTKTANDIFSLDTFIDNKRIITNCNYTTLEAYHGSLEEKIDEYFKCINYIINTYMGDIISGKSWEVFPVNWGPYK